MWPFTSQAYKTLNTITIDSLALARNHQSLQAFHPEAKICPVLKSNAYGHGIAQVAPLFDALQPAFLVTDSLFEAYELAKIGVQSPILIMGYTHPENFKVKRLPFTYCLYDLEIAAALNHYQPGAKVHIFLDTGMNREGVKLENLAQFATQLKTFSNLEIEGVASHFSEADNPKSQDFTQKQIQRFKQGLQILESLGIQVKWKHISASAGAFKYHDATFNMIRVGIASYGISPLETHDSAAAKVQLQPALSFNSTLIQIRHLSKGEVMGYGNTFKAKKSVTVGLLPAGYYEGVDRRLSNQGFVKIKDVFCPILGRVSMNMTSVDISEVPNPKVGDKVQIYSNIVSDKNSVAHVAAIAGTIPYELMVHLAESVKREVS